MPMDRIYEHEKIKLNESFFFYPCDLVNADGTKSVGRNIMKVNI